MFKKGENVDFTVTFEGDVSSVPTFKPGSTVNGHLRIDAHKDVSCKKIELDLEWQTQGKGYRNGDRIDTSVFDVFELTPDTPFETDFTFVLPERPWSYEGQLIKIVWGIGITIDIEHSMDLFGIMDINHLEPIIVQP